MAAFVALISGCKSDSPLDPLGRAAAINAASAATFAGVVGTTAASAPTVRVTDKNGDPVSGVQVSFTVTAGSGAVNPSTVVTGGDGQATTAWTLGTAVETNTLKATAGSLAPVVFTATTVAGPPAILERSSGDNQIVAVQSTAAPLRVRVTDSYHNPLSGISVSFRIASGGGTIAPAATASDATGLVTAIWTLGPTEGVQNVQAQAAGANVLFTADTFTCVTSTGTAPCTGLGELIFVRSSDSQIYRMNVDGKGLTKMTSTGSHDSPVWSPDGKRIAFITANSGSQENDVYLMNADGSNVVRRTSGGSYYYSVTWSPDGRSLTVDASSGGDSLNILTMAADGVAPATVLIPNAGSPSWSPDGKQIAYSRGTAYYDASQIYVRNADGTNVRRATPDSAGWNWNARWSPDGQKISFTRCLTSCAAYTTEVNSANLAQVSPSDGSRGSGWSPYGRWLALTVYGVPGGGRSTPPSINYIPSAGGTSRLILTDAYSPSWRPVTR